MTESTPQYYYPGRIYDFRYYNRPLSASEIDDIYRNGKLFGDEVLRLPETAHVGIPRLLKSVKEVDTTDYTTIRTYEIKIQFGSATNEGTYTAVNIAFLIDGVWSKEYTVASSAADGALITANLTLNGVLLESKSLLKDLISK